jgi:hypothetical protein
MGERTTGQGRREKQARYLVARKRGWRRERRLKGKSRQKTRGLQEMWSTMWQWRRSMVRARTCATDGSWGVAGLNRDEAGGAADGEERGGVVVEGGMRRRRVGRSGGEEGGAGQAGEQRQREERAQGRPAAQLQGLVRLQRGRC